MNEPVGIWGKVPMMLASLFLSFLLWGYIQVIQPAGSKDVDGVNLDAVNMDKYQSRYIFPEDLGAVTVRIDGPQDQLAEDQAGLARILKENRVFVYVDFNDLHPGNHSYPVNIISRHDSPFTFTPLPDTIKEDVEVRAEHRFQVAVDPTGEVSKDLNLIYTGATTEPSAVVVSGPAPAVNQVKRVRALLDLSKVAPHDTNLEILDALDENDHVVPGVDISPARVNVLPSVAPAAQSQMVLIQPVWAGHPALGLEVANYVVEPNQVAIQGPPEVLAKLRTVPTKPIPLNGLGSSFWFDTALDLPPGVKPYSPHSIRVHVILKTQTSASNSAASPSQPITVP